MIKATLMLCDFAQVAEGKLYIAGGGWSVATAMQGHIAVLFRIPWDRANHRIPIVLTLLDQDGGMVPDGNGTRLDLELEVGRPPGLPRGTDLDAPLAIGIPPIQLPPGRYEWVLSIDGEAEDHWHLPFLIKMAR
ncbi:MAG: hypothetical protein WBZ37_29265 [Mycobacterium sp.]